MRGGPVDVFTASFFAGVGSGIATGIVFALVSFVANGFEPEELQLIIWLAPLGGIIGVGIIWPTCLISIIAGVWLARRNLIFARRSVWLISGAVIGSLILVSTVAIGLTLTNAAIGAASGALAAFISHLMLSPSDTPQE